MRCGSHLIREGGARRLASSVTFGTRYYAGPLALSTPAYLWRGQWWESSFQVPHQLRPLRAGVLLFHGMSVSH